MQHTLVVSALYQDVSGQNISAMAEALANFDYTSLFSGENVEQKAAEANQTMLESFSLASQMAASSRIKSDP